MKYKNILATIALGLSAGLAQPSFAHEGHDEVPGTLKAVRGGVIKSLDDASIELLVTGSTIKLYPSDSSGKPMAPASLSMTATVALPKAQSVALTLAPKADHWEATFDAKGVHRYTLMLTLKDGEHEHQVDFIIEPQESE